MRKKRNELRNLLRNMQVGETELFHRSKRNSVRPTCSNLKYDECLNFSTWTEGDKLFVKRLENEYYDNPQ